MAHFRSLANNEKFYKFITEVQDAVDTFLPFKSIRVHQLTNLGLQKKSKFSLRDAKLYLFVMEKVPLPTNF